MARGAAATLARPGTLRACTRRSPSCSPTSPPRRDCSRAVNVSGSPANKQFILEEMGCGAAFFDYDHDGWLDIFLVNGSSFDPKARDARPDELPVPQQSRRHVHRRHGARRA